VEWVALEGQLSDLQNHREALFDSDLNPIQRVGTGSATIPE
jgi:hypothetical protein